MLLSHTHRFQGQVVCSRYMLNQAWHSLGCLNFPIFSVQLSLSCENFMDYSPLFIIQVLIIVSCNNIWKRKKNLSSRKHNIPLETCFSLHRLRVYNLVPRFVALKNKVNFGVESWSFQIVRRTEVAVDLERTHNYFVELLALYQRRMI